MGMTPEERRATIGDPYSPFAYYNPKLGYGMAESARARSRELRGEGAGSIRGALDRYNLTLDPGVAGSQQAALARMDQELGGAVPREALGIDPGLPSITR